MTTLDEALTALRRRIIVDAECACKACTDRYGLLAALEAVVGLHRENGPDDGVCQGGAVGGYGYLDSWCVECSAQSGREYGTVYPCPTVQAITTALAGGAK